MKVARLHGVGDVRVSEEPVPVPGPGQSLVRVSAVGLCGSDVHWFTHGSIGDAHLSAPLVLGHEFAGVIVGGTLDGRRVAVDPARPCGTCEQCLAGNRNLCPTTGFAGHGTHDGGLREFAVWPTAQLHPLPTSVDDAAGALLEPFGVALHAHDLGKPRVGAVVVIVGCGPIGLCLIQLARAGGALRVVAVEPLAHRRAIAVALGAHVVVDPTGGDIGAAIAEVTGGSGGDVVWEVAGTADSVNVAVGAAKVGGRVILVGIPDEDSSSFTASVARRKGLTIKLSRRMKEMYPRTTALVRDGLVDLAPLVTHTFALAQVSDAFTVAAARTGLKVIVTPGT